MTLDSRSVRASRLVALVAASTIAPGALAGSHLWDFWELFSTEDGSVQFIELYVPLAAPGEINLMGKKITSQATGKSFTFPSNLTGSTSFKHLLLATASYAALPGAATPDFIIPPNFFSPNGDTLKWHVYDTFTFTGAEMPTDCELSLNRNKTTSINTPHNYPGAIGEVYACPCLGDVNGDGDVDGADLGEMLGAWGTAAPEYDLNGDGAVDGADLGELLGAWGEC